MISANWKCGQCKNDNPADAPVCICGQERPAPSVPGPSASKRRFPLWIAGLPGLIAVGILMINAAVQFGRVAGKINPNATDSSKSPGTHCVETYGVTLRSSDLYVRESPMGIPANAPNTTPEMSTVVRGMVHNGCGEDLRNVRIRFVVSDEAGKKGTGTYQIDSLAIGEAKPFERAWIGRVTSYEVTADR